MRAPALGLALAVLCTTAFAQEPGNGEAATCDAFDWSLKQEQAWFAAPALPKLETGGTLPPGAPGAVLMLKPYAEAALPNEPSRKPKPDTFAGILKVDAPPMPGVFQITLSDEGWIDVVQDSDGQQGKEPRSPIAHTGKRNCPGLRKSLRYQLASKPFTVTISNATSASIKIAVAPVP